MRVCHTINKGYFRDEKLNVKLWGVSGSISIYLKLDVKEDMCVERELTVAFTSSQASNKYEAGTLPLF